MKKIVSAILFLFLIINAFGQSKSPLQISHLTGDFYVYKTFHNYDRALISANAMYLFKDKSVVLFEYLNTLSDKK